MAKLDVTYDILQDSPASASPVEANFNRIEQHINQEVIERGGTVAMAAQLQLVGDPVSPLDAAPKQYVDAIIPIGIIMMYGGVAAPPGGKWAICNGAELESALYPELFAVVGTAYSLAGTPAGRFNLPNLTDRFGIGAGSVASLGKSGGSKDSVVPTHSHTMNHAHPAGDSGVQSTGHTHAGVDHLHPVNGNTGGQSNNHYHNDQGTGMYMFAGTGPNAQVSLDFYDGGPQQWTVNHWATTAWAAQDHSHRVDIWSGAADRSLTTGNISNGHVHGFTTPTMTGSTGVEGVAVTDTNLPPYLGVTYIIRIY